MNAGNISLLNAIVLVAMGAWGYLGSDDPSPTALIPVGIGIALLAMNPGVRAHNKMIAHIAVLLTLLILFGLVMPMKGAIGRSDSLAIFRVATMIATTVLALVVFIKSFIDARRLKNQASEAVTQD